MEKKKKVIVTFVKCVVVTEQTTVDYRESKVSLQSPKIWFHGVNQLTGSQLDVSQYLCQQKTYRAVMWNLRPELDIRKSDAKH